MNSSRVQTVLEIVGIQQPSITWKNSVLIVIDAQNEYRHGRIPIPNLEKSLHVLQSLLKSARINKAPIVHVHHQGKSGGLFDSATNNFNSLPEVSPIPGEPIVLKTLPNSFTNTELKKIVDLIGGDRILILAGYMTHNCVSSTARGALDLGYTTAIVRDAVASRDLPGPSGTVISAGTVSDANLAGLQERTSWIIESKALIE